MKRHAIYADIEAVPLFPSRSTELWPLDPPPGLAEDPQHLFVGDR
jgi:hypothetical protein